MLNMGRNDIPSQNLLQHTEMFSSQTHQVNAHTGIGNRDTAVIEPINDGDRYFVKFYSSAAPAYNKYPGRQILFDINTEKWSGREPPGGGEYEYHALQRIKSTPTSTPGTTSPDIIVPSPIEYVDEMNALILGYIDEDVNMRDKLFPYTWPAIRRRFSNTSTEVTAIMSEISEVIRQFHQRTENGNTFDMSSYLSAHESLISDSTFVRINPDIINQLKSLSPPDLPECCLHGDFLSRNILTTESGKYGFVDWNLSILAHPFIDIHRFSLDLWRWSFFPLSNGDELDRVRKTFVETYLSISNISYYGYIFTKITALLRFYYLYVDIQSGVTTPIYRRMVDPISKEISRCINILRAHESS